MTCAIFEVGFAMRRYGLRSGRALPASPRGKRVIARGRFPVATVTAALALALSGPALASVTVFTDATLFAGAAGPLELETFNGVVGEPNFRTSPVVVGDLSFQGVGPHQSDRNYIDQPPAQFGGLNVDGTTVVNMLTFGGVSQSSITITFAHAINAFGASFRSWNSGALRSHIEVLGQSLQPGIAPASEIRFFGFVSDTPFTSLSFVADSGAAGNGIGMDNAYYSAAVPEPCVWLMMITGFGLAGAALRRRRPGREAFASYQG
jgi:hypothetical protein